MANTREEVTIHGNVEYETATCDCCQHEVVKEETTKAYLGTPVRSRSYGSKLKLEYQMPHVDTLRFCSVCAEEEPSIARGVRRVTRERKENRMIWTAWLLTTIILVVGIVVIL